MATTDITPPKLTYVYVSSTNNQVGLTLLFSEAIKPNVSGLSLYAWDPSLFAVGNRISLLTQFVANSNNLAALPLGTMDVGQTYQLALTRSTAQDLAGNLLGSDALWGVESQLPIFIQPFNFSAGLSLQVWGNPEEGAALEAKLASVSILSGAVKASYQWQVKTDSVWTNLPSANTAVLSIPSDQSWVGKEIRVSVQTSLALSGFTQFQSLGLKVANVNDTPVAAASSFTLVEDSVAQGNLSASDDDANVLTFVKVTDPAHGSVTVNATTGAYTYTPAVNYNGSDSFTFRVNDGLVDSAVATVSLSVSAVNDAPTAQASSLTTDEDVIQAGTLAGSDVEGSALTFLKVSNPSHGSLSLNATTGAYTYTPAANYNGSDSFSFKVNDGVLDSEPATVSVTVRAVNDAPVANSTSSTTQEDSSKTGTLTGTDVEGSSLTFAKVSDPAHGNVTVNTTTGVYTYTPAANYNGTDSFTFKVNDGALDSALATIALTVNAVNDAPTASAASVVTSEDTAKTGALTGSDVDGNTLTFAKVSDPSHGSVTVNVTTGAYTYTPAVNYNGTDSFTFKVNDGSLDAEAATVTLVISAVNDAPTASPTSATTIEDTTQAGTLTGNDVEGSSLTFAKVSDPSHGSVTVNATTGAYTYIPASNYNGTDSFTFKVNDGTLNSEAATVSLVISAVNDAPTASAASATTSEDTAKTGTLTGTDVEGSTLTFAKVSDPSHGSLTVNASTGAYTYTPAANYDGTDSFTFKVNDGALDSDTATITLTVSAVNDAPLGTATSITTDEDTAKTGTLVGTDIEGSTLTFAKVSDPSHGSVTVNATTGAYTYTPAANFNGTDSFTFKVNDGVADSEAATVLITVGSVNDAPVVTDLRTSTAEDIALSGRLSGTDPEGSALTWIQVAAPSHGSVTLNAITGAYVYTPVANYNGTDSFTFKVNDGALDSETATVFITLTAVNDAPTAVAISASTNEDTAKSGLLSGTDVEGSTLTFAKVTDPQHGTVTLNATTGAYTYTPATNYNGSDSFTYKVNDGALDSAVSQVTVTVAAVNDAPVANALRITTDEDTPSKGQLTGADTEGSTLSFFKVSDPSRGTVVINAATGAYTYTPTANANGVDRFSFKVNDGALDSEVVSVEVQISAVNDAPVASSLSVNGYEDGVLTGVLPGSDVEGSALTYAKLSDPLNGVVVLNAATGAYTYTPAANYNGSDSFTFKVNDGTLDSGVGTLSVTLAAVNDAPQANGVTLSGFEDTVKTGQLTGSDVEGSALSFAKVSEPSHGSLTLNTETGAFSYTPSANYNGSDRFAFKVNDGIADSDVVWVVFAVSAVNDAPVANAAEVRTSEDLALAGTLSGADVEGNTLTFAIVSDPAHGTVKIDEAKGTYLYTPDADYNGSDSFSFKVNDGALDADVSTVSVTVVPVNDAPLASSFQTLTQEDTPKTGTLRGSDVEQSVLTFAKGADPRHGTVSIDALTGFFTYTPDLNYAGDDSFTYRVNDGSLNSVPATVTVQVGPVNDAPEANEYTLATLEDTEATGQLGGFDVEGTSLTYILVSAPARGTLVIQPSGQFSYLPALNDSGANSFSFRVSDGVLLSEPMVVQMSVLAVNDAPTADAVQARTSEDKAFSGTLTGADAEGDALTFTALSQPSHGSVTVNATTGVYTYTPEPDFFGTDSFTFATQDGTLSSLAATVTLVVAAVNDAPVAQSQTVTAGEDLGLAGQLVGTDAEGSSLTYFKVSDPAHGTVTLNASAGTYTYTPLLNYNGVDSFSYKVSDGLLDSDIVKVTLTLTAVNDAPTALTTSLTCNEDTPLTGSLLGADVEGSALSFAMVSQASHGVLELNKATGAYTYTPASHFSGLDSFSYKVNDGVLDSDAVVVSLKVRSKSETNHPPVALAASAVTTEDSVTTGSLSATDADADRVTFAKVSSPSHGTLSFNTETGAYQYTPANNYAGEDSFTFKVSDGLTESAVATVSLVITAVNDAPTAVAIGASTNEDTAKSGLLSGTDVEGSTLTFAKVTDPQHGTVTVNATTGAYTYTPAANFNGSDSFTYKVNDGVLDSAVSQVTVTVVAVNDAPVANALRITTDEDTPSKGQLTGADTEGSTLSFVKVSDPSRGTVVINAATGAYTYTPAANATGVDRFSFKVNDGALDSEVASVEVQISAVNDAPVASSLSVNGYEDGVLTGVLPGSDVEGSALTYAKLSDPLHGVVVLNAATGAYTYTPAANYNGSDSFTFKVNDGALDSGVGTLSVSLAAVNDAPQANGMTLSGFEDTVKTGQLTGSDVEGSALSFAKVSEPSHGSLTLNTETGAFSYTPELNFWGADHFTFRVSDGAARSDPVEVTLLVNAMDDTASASLTVTGTGLLGTSLSLGVSDLQDPDGTMSFATQWQRKQTTGEWVDLAQANSVRWQVPTDAAWADAIVRAQVTTTDEGGGTTLLYSPEKQIVSGAYHASIKAYYASQLIDPANAKLLGNVTVTFPGFQGTTTSTAALEATTIVDDDGVDDGKVAYTVDAPLPANVKQAITLSDVLGALKIYLGKSGGAGAASSMSRLAADFDADGQVTLGDVLKLLKYYLGKSETVQPQWVWVNQQDINTNKITISNYLNAQSLNENNELYLIGVISGDVNFSLSH